MKKLFIFTLIILLPVFLFSSCMPMGPSVSLAYVDWYTTTEKIGDLTFGNVHLQISGFTTGDKVTVMTYGDGVIGEYELDLNQDKTFSEDIIIQFTHEADNIARKYSTVLTAYGENAMTEIKLESEALAFLNKNE